MPEPEIAVAGAGPAGTTAALQLARLGYRVTIYEKRRFPRPRIGESLTPGIIPVFDSLGLTERVDAGGFLRPTSAIVQWDRLRERIPFENGLSGYQVDRARFDSILLDSAVAAGARVEWRALTDARNAFVVDASGRRGIIPGPRARLSSPLLALYAYWRGAVENDVATIVEAGLEHWLWAAPLPDGTLNITVFLDPMDARDPQSAYREAVLSSKLLRPLITGATYERISATDASCWVALQPSGDGFIKVGEAAFSVDALSSQGVQMAMQSGWQAAAVIHTILSGGDAVVARQFYDARQLTAAIGSHRIATSYYAKLADAGPFWAKRSIPAAMELPPMPGARLLGNRIEAVDWRDQRYSTA